MSRSKDYSVGYGRPPVSTRFPKGKSGNPRGRPKGAKNLTTLLAEELNRKIAIREGDVTRRVTKREAMVKRICESALKGDHKALMAIMQVDRGDGSDRVAPDQTDLSAEDREILSHRLAALMASEGKE
jgi:Family of unknown function (DUF5681)